MTEHQPQSAAAGYQLICGAVAAMPLLYMIVAAGLKLGGIMEDDGLAAVDPEQAGTVSIALLAAGIVASVASIPMKKLLVRSQTAGMDAPAGRFKATLVSMSISESGAVMGLVLMLLTGNLLYGGLLCGLSFAVTCFHFPSRHWLERGDRPL